MLTKRAAATRHTQLLLLKPRCVCVLLLLPSQALCACHLPVSNFPSAMTMWKICKICAKAIQRHLVIKTSEHTHLRTQHTHGCAHTHTHIHTYTHTDTDTYIHTRTPTHLLLHLLNYRLLVPLSLYSFNLSLTPFL